MGNTYYRRNGQIDNHLNNLNINLNDPSLILSPYLYLGSNLGNRYPKHLKRLGITHVLNVAIELAPNYELLMDPRIKYKHIPCDDTLNYNIRYHFDEAFDFMDRALASNGKLIVHCAMGISRSATFVIAYLMKRYRMSLQSAYLLVKSRRSEINPNPGFMKALQQFEYELSMNQSNNIQMKMLPFHHTELDRPNILNKIH